MSLPYFPMYPADFEADTSHLTLEEDGAYNRLLRLMWMTPGCSIPSDPAWIARRLRVDAETFDRVVAPLLKEFFRRNRSRYYSPRLSVEFANANTARNGKSRGGKESARRRKSLKENTTDPKTLEGDLGDTRALPEPEPDSSVETNVSTAAGAAPDPDPVKAMFDAGVRMLVQAGTSDAKARSILGKWKRDHGPEAVIVALGRAQREGAVDPVSFVEAALRWKAKQPAKGAPHDGDERTLPSGQLQRYSAFDGWMNVYG